MIDPNNDEIADLIKQEDDPKTRALLIILQNINLSLIANTQTVNDIDVQLKEHLVEFKTRVAIEDAEDNQKKGAWRVIAAILGVLQAAALGAISYGITELKTLHTADAVLEARVLLLEHKK